jgi:hypothetical protein
MNWKTVATIGVVSGAVVTLLATAAPSIHSRPDTIASTPSIDSQQGAALITATARLRERVSPQTRPSASTRNPFAFGQAAAASGTGRSGAAQPLAPRPSTDANQGLPSFTLVGLAEDRTPDGTILTAILSSPGALQFVKEGDRVDGRYRVAAITSDSVQLRDDAGPPLLLRLK